MKDLIRKQPEGAESYRKFLQKEKELNARWGSRGWGSGGGARVSLFPDGSLLPFNAPQLPQHSDCSSRGSVQ